MFEPIERSEDDIRFTPLWYISGALILAAGITLFFTSHRAVADILKIAGCLVLIFAGLRTKQETTKPLTLGLTSPRKKTTFRDYL
jgi:threonine/homoserine/homoserine lactone efflux protein